MPSFLPELTRGARVVRTAVAAAALAVVALPQAHAAGVSGQGTWETTLQGRDLDGDLVNGYEAYYDTALNITWLADANYAKTSGYDSDGLINWDGAKKWAAELNVNGKTGWRLPTMSDTGASGCDDSTANGIHCGYNVQTLNPISGLAYSELAYLYYTTLGNKAYCAPGDDGCLDIQDGGGLTNVGNFKNVDPTFFEYPYFFKQSYWTEVEYAPGLDAVWAFSMSGGYQYSNYSKTQPLGMWAWAVHSGDIAAVPEPQTYALALAGLAAAALMARKRRA